MSTTTWDILAATIVIAIIYMLVRPGSPAKQAVDDVSNALSNLLLVATGWNPHGGTAPGSWMNSNPNPLPA